MQTLRIVAVGILISVGALRASDYLAAKSSAITRCESIDAADYQSGLLFNPDGYRSYFVRSECFQTVAVEFRDIALCEQVRERRSVMSSSWGYSAAQCRKLVAQGVAADRAAIEEMKARYVQGAISVRALRIERNGNGRDFDFVPEFSGTYAHGYLLTFEILDAGGPNNSVGVHSTGYYLDERSNLRIFVRQNDIRKQFPDFELNRRYRVRATVVLDLGSGGAAGRWSDAFIEQVFPSRERSKSITISTVF